MRIAMWAAVAVTLLLGLANLGEVAQSNLGLRILGPVLATAAVVAVFGLATGKPWGAGSVVALGAVNLVAAVIGAVAGLDGWSIGLVLAGLAVILAFVARPVGRSVVAS